MVAAQRKVVLTDRTLQALKKANQGKRYITWDAMQPHLGVRVTDTGAKSFVLVKRQAGARHPLTAVLGRYPSLSLKDARTAAGSTLKVIAEGKSPSLVKQEAAREDARRRADSVGKALEAFLEHEAGRALRTLRGTESVLRREFLGQTPIREKVPSERGGGQVTEWKTTWKDGGRRYGGPAPSPRSLAGTS